MEKHIPHRGQAAEHDKQGDLHQALDELAAYKFALDASAIVAVTDSTGRIIHANNLFCEISKYEREELLGQDHRILNSGTHPKSFFEDLWKTIKSGKVWQGDIRNRAKDGSHYWVATTIVPFLDEAGVPYQFVAIRSEITQRKLAEVELERTVENLEQLGARERLRAEALEEARNELEEANRRILVEQTKLIQAEKLSSIGLLAAGVAHEVNNPLSGVMGCLQAIERGRVSGTRREEYFKTAREGLERIQATVRGLLDYARQSPPKWTDVNLAEVVGASINLVAPAVRKKNIQLKEGVGAGRIVRADRSQVMQATINLLLNAVYVSPLDSSISVDVIDQPNRLGLRIADKGPGMPEEIVRRACDPFFTTKPEGEGTGLGLAVTLRIARAHGGDLDIETGDGVGTAMTLWLPTSRGNDAKP